jgi:hypothetical protein
MTDFKKLNLWHETDGDPLGDDLDVVNSDLDYLKVDMDVLAPGLDCVSLVWVRILQLKTMRKTKWLLLGQKWFTKHGVCGRSRNRALEVLEKLGFVQIRHVGAGNVRVAIITKNVKSKPTRRAVHGKRTKTSAARTKTSRSRGLKRPDTGRFSLPVTVTLVTLLLRHSM